MADPADLVEARERMKKERVEALERRQKEKEETREILLHMKREGSEDLWEPEAASLASKRAKTAVTTGGPKETVPATVKSTSDMQSKVGRATTLAPQHTSRTPPSNKTQLLSDETATRGLVRGRDVLTLQEQEFWTRFTDLETSDLLAEFNNPGWQSPGKKTSGVATLPQLKVDTIPSSSNIDVPHALKDTAIASTLDSSSGELPSTFPLTLKNPASATLSNTSPAGPIASSPTLDNTASTPSSNTNLAQFNNLFLTLPPAPESPLDLDAGKASSTDDERADDEPKDPFRLFDLPQELQDAIFEYAYTEPGYKNAYKRDWEVKQTHRRKTKGTPRAPFPTHKVNEWMVSKRYFRAAAKAWMEAQTCPKFVTKHLLGPPFSKFPIISHTMGANGLVLEFARTIVLDSNAPFSSRDSQLVSQFRRLRNLVCVIDEDFLDESDRGYAWEVEYTDDEFRKSLNRANFLLPPGIAFILPLVQRQPMRYATTPERLAIYSANMAKLQLAVSRHSRHKEVKPGAATSNDDDALYLGSKVTGAPPVEQKLPEPAQKGKRFKENHFY